MRESLLSLLSRSFGLTIRKNRKKFRAQIRKNSLLSFVMKQLTPQHNSQTTTYKPQRQEKKLEALFQNGEKKHQHFLYPVSHLSHLRQRS